MTAERWQLAYEIYEAAAALAQPERSQYVRHVAPDAEIAAKVFAMLDEMEAIAGSDGFPEPSPSDHPTDATSLPNGTMIDRFVITGVVGQGGMGKVYSAHDPDLHREVALKVIAQRAEASSLEKFIREAQAASALNHPNIVTVHEVIRSGPTLAIAMELVTGTSLRSFCGAAQPIGKVALWGRQIAAALAAAHARGIVHRDIKPENLMLRNDGYIKVLDFGLAREAGADRAAESAEGTFGYISPEEFLQQRITAASDIFALGVVLYELAAGTNPFLLSSGVTTRRMDPGSAVQLQRESLPHAEFDRLVSAMVRTSPADRPSASDVLLRLEAIAQPPHSKRRAVWLAAALATAVLTGISAWRVLPLQRADSKPALLPSLPLDSEPASETSPSFSPDGSRIAYASDLGSPGIHHIVTRSVMRLASGVPGSSQPLTLTTSAKDDSNPVWSPDGSRIAFLRRISGETLVAIVVPAGGGTERVVATLPGSRPGARKFLTWAPDGQALVGALRLGGSFAIRLYRFPLDGGPARPVTVGPEGAQDVSPAFSPDGRWLAFLRWENGATYTLWLVSQPGGEAKLLVTSPIPISSFAWRADSQTIVYGGGAISTGELRQVTVEGVRTLAPFVLEGASDEIAIAPNGGRLAYVLQDLDANIWRLPLTRDTNSPAAEKLFASTREEMDPAISPDGRSVAFISNRSGHWSLWMGNADGTGLRELTAPHLLPFHPAWSPASREIAFDSVASGKGEIWLINPSGGSARRLVGIPGGAQVPSWSRDGKRVFFYSNTGGSRQIWEVPASGGTPVQLTRGASFDPAESPDGRYLYHGNSLSPGLWRTPLAPRAPDGSLVNQDGELIRETLAVTAHRFWALGQGGIYFVDAQSIPAELKFVNLTTKSVTGLARLAKPPAKFTRGLAISPDGRYALYCQDDVDRYEIRIVENFR